MSIGTEALEETLKSILMILIISLLLKLYLAYFFNLNV